MKSKAMQWEKRLRMVLVSVILESGVCALGNNFPTKVCSRWVNIIGSKIILLSHIRRSKLPPQNPTTIAGSSWTLGFVFGHNTLPQTASKQCHPRPNTYLLPDVSKEIEWSQVIATRKELFEIEGTKLSRIEGTSRWCECNWIRIFERRLRGWSVLCVLPNMHEGALSSGSLVAGFPPCQK